MCLEFFHMEGFPMTADIDGVYYVIKPIPYPKRFLMPQEYRESNIWVEALPLAWSYLHRLSESDLDKMPGRKPGLITNEMILTWLDGMISNGYIVIDADKTLAKKERERVLAAYPWFFAHKPNDKVPTGPFTLEGPFMTKDEAGEQFIPWLRQIPYMRNLDPFQAVDRSEAFDISRKHFDKTP